MFKAIVEIYKAGPPKEYKKIKKETCKKNADK
jgi:hypothetical protein